MRSFFLGTEFNRTINNFFGPPWMAVRLVPIFGALAAAWPFRFHRYNLLVCAICMCFGLVYTLLYIYPINAILIFEGGGSLSPDEIKLMAERWVFADRLRFIVLFTGYVFLLRAFARPLTH